MGGHRRAALALLAIGMLAGCGDDGGEERTVIGPNPPPAVVSTTTTDPRVGPTAPTTTIATTTAPPETESPTTTTAPVGQDGTGGTGPTTTTTTIPPPVTTQAVPPAPTIPAAATPMEAAARFAAGMLAGHDVSLVAKRDAMRQWVELGLPTQSDWQGSVTIPPEYNDEWEGAVVCEIWGDQTPVCVVALVPGPDDDLPYTLLQMSLSLADNYDGPWAPVPGTEHPPMVVNVVRFTPGMRP